MTCQDSEANRYAGIDIGTNTILMVIGERRGQYWNVISDHHAIARLGEGVDDAGLISEEALNRAVTIIEDYRSILDGASVHHIRAAATSAVRDARNADFVLASLSAACGATVSVISGAEEASLTFAGTVGRGPFPAGVCDIGGGSTELVFGTEGSVRESISLQIGAVRLTERWRRGECPRGTVALPPLDRFIPVEHWYGVAGTPVSLAMLDQEIVVYDGHRIDGYMLHRERVVALTEQLLEWPPEEMIDRGIPAARADILPAGAVILRGLMTSLGADRIEVSTRGLRYGLMMTADRKK
ncbi:MAG: Ppx/GppA family phosphatase [Candidatus Kapabacteria bacterium]|nr:Ppx/GppA family phosphatase [Candidatus Kapabacteria bacterium]